MAWALMGWTLMRADRLSKLEAEIAAANSANGAAHAANLELQARYDDLVRKVKSTAAKDKPARKARTFSEFRDAEERGVRPRGMKEKKP